MFKYLDFGQVYSSQGTKELAQELEDKGYDWIKDLT